MGKILNLDDMLDIAETDGSELMLALVAACEASATALTEAIAAKFEITTNGKGAKFESGFGGLCGVFEPAFKGQECPQEIESGDPGGEFLHPEEESELEAAVAEMREAASQRAALEG